MSNNPKFVYNNFLFFVLRKRVIFLTLRVFLLMKLREIQRIETKLPVSTEANEVDVLLLTENENNSWLDLDEQKLGKFKDL